MKPFEMSVTHKNYPVRAMIEDACIVLAPSLLLLIGLLWVYRKEWDSVWLAHFLMSFLPFN